MAESTTELKIGDKVKDIYSVLIGKIVEIHNNPIYIVEWDSMAQRKGYTGDYKHDEIYKIEEVDV